MKSLTSFIRTRWGIALILAAIISIAYLVWAKIEIENYIRSKEAVRITPSSDIRYVKDIGYVRRSNISKRLLKREVEISWIVRVPKTNETYICLWGEGYTGFHAEEGVELVHIPGGGEGGDEWDGYIIGLHDSNKGKIAAVSALDEDVWAVDDEGDRQ